MPERTYWQDALSPTSRTDAVAGNATVAPFLLMVAPFGVRLSDSTSSLNDKVNSLPLRPTS